MSLQGYFKALTLYKRGEVKLALETSLSLYFLVKDYSVLYDGKKDQWSCTCEFGSIWSMQKNNCSHINACLIWKKKNALRKAGGK